jgi:hypothetical protein
MKLFKNIKSLAEGSDMSELPEMAMKDIQSNIRKGAQDTTQSWSNALELVHRAYKVSNIQRPTPGMKAAWKQYDENITYSVSQLAKARGMKGDWRMSASSLREEAQMTNYKVILDIPNTEKRLDVTVASPDLNGVIDIIKQKIKADPGLSHYEVKIDDFGDGVQLTFWSHGVRRNGLVRITKG